jgi:Glucose / Sorbosone dehydrogenase
MGSATRRARRRLRRSTTAAFLGAALLASSSAAPATGQTPDPGAQPITDPIPEEATPAGFGLVLREVVTLPESEPTPATTDVRLVRHARINYLGELPDGSGRHYVPDLNGTLYFVEDGASQPYLDVKAAVGPNFWSGRGLGSGFGFVAFHPEFRRNGKFYTVHTEALDALVTEPVDLPSQPNPSVHSIITEWTADDPAADTFTGTRRELMRVGFRTFIHGFQQIAFNPTARRHDADYGLLYIGAGDGGAGTTSTDAQNLGMPHGKVLRIDPAGSNSTNGEYGIPRRNPFVGEPGALGEVYAYGLRNPHRFSWDPTPPHRMYLGNIGEKRVESVYEVRPGDNFGWTFREGVVATRPGDPNCDVYPLPANDEEFGFTYPVAAYDHDRPAGLGGCADSGFAVIGGFVHRRHDIPALRGKYLFGEDVGGELYYTETRDMRRGRGLAPIRELAVFTESGQPTTMQELAGDERVDLRFGQDAEGRVYVLSKANGTIWEVVGTRPFRPV